MCTIVYSIRAFPQTVKRDKEAASGFPADCGPDPRTRLRRSTASSPANANGGREKVPLDRLLGAAGILHAAGRHIVEPLALLVDQQQVNRSRSSLRHVKLPCSSIATGGTGRNGIAIS
jgi:hypothetical protein